MQPFFQSPPQQPLQPQPTTDETKAAQNAADEQLLSAWRVNWQPDEIKWRTGWQAQRDERRQERERNRQERRRRDRVVFGETAWGTPQAKQQAAFNPDKLTQAGLPALASETQLAAWLSISLKELRWYTHDRPVDSVWHYVRFEVPKRRGGTRVILAPKTRLKAIQRQINRDLLAKIAPHPAAHGFVPEHSIATHAQPHVGRAFVLNLDLKDFFPSIGYRRVRGLFLSMGYSLAVASALALLCTERERTPIERADGTVFVSKGERALIQGAPTSPALANLIARKLDARLMGLAEAMKLNYSRYADDLTFSGDDYNAIRTVQQRAANLIIRDEGFTPQPDKMRLYRQSNRQVVTGMVVNTKLNTPRELRRRLRAILHAAAQTGLAAQNREQHPHFRAYLLGLIGHLGQSDPVLAAKLVAQLRTIPDEQIDAPGL